MRGDKHAQQTLLRLRVRFGDVMLSSALNRLKAEAVTKRGPGARKIWDGFLDRYFYFHVDAITERGFNLTEAKHKFSEKTGDSFDKVEKAYLRGLKLLEGKSPDEKKLMRDDYITAKSKNYLKQLKRPARTR
jgi:hypothetical protein